MDPQGAPAVMQERPPVCVTDCKSLYDHLSAVGSPSTLHDKRSAIDVLIIRESMKKTGCVIRWAPTGLQLADGHTKDKGEAVECLRRSLRSGSYMLRCEEQVMQERHMTRVQKLSTSEKRHNGGEILMRLLGSQSWRTGVLLFRGYGCRPVLISTHCRCRTRFSSTILYLKTVASLISIRFRRLCKIHYSSIPAIL